MKVTPLEIRQQTFERGFRGYEKEAVDAYLASLSQEWERSQDDFRALRQRNETLEEEIGRLKAIENTLYRTLQTAEETSTQMAQKSRAEAEQRVQSANAEAEETLGNARKQANMLVLDAETKTRYIVDEALEELRSLERDYKAIERYKEYLITEIKRYATDAFDKLSRFEEKSHRSTFEAKFGEVKALKMPGTEASPQPAEDSDTPTTTWEIQPSEASPAEEETEDIPRDEAPAPSAEERPRNRPRKAASTENEPEAPSGSSPEAAAPSGSGSFFDSI
ncbi:MAG: DivIVA domain-containing protein [Sphingobacteriaceae bacterium]|nr:DivIVA domain-containing protein [Cytophagaceae bacterium]